MPIKTYKTLDEIPEAHRGDALELKSGEYAVLEEPDTSGLSTALQSEREKREAAERLAKKAADDLKRLQTDKKAADAGLSAEQLAKIREEVRADVLKELEPDLVKGKSALEENRALKLDQRVKAIALKHGVRADRIEAWWKLNRDRFDLTDDGEAPIVKGQPGSKLETFVGETLKKETPEFYEGTKAAGTGISAGTGMPGTGISADDVIKNPAAALSAVRAQGKAA